MNDDTPGFDIPGFAGMEVEPWFHDQIAAAESRGADRERVAIVEWLRDEGWPEIAAIAIEAGEHREKENENG